MIFAWYPDTVGCAGVLGDAGGEPMPAPPVPPGVVGVVVVVVVVVVGDAAPAASAVAGTASASSAQPEIRKRVNGIVLFRRPAGLAVGLAQKEQRLPRINRGISPMGTVGSPAPRRLIGAAD